MSAAAADVCLFIYYGLRRTGLPSKAVPESNLSCSSLCASFISISMFPPAPVPFHTLRTHSSPLASLHFSTSTPNSLLYAGDQDGWISVLDLKVRRVIAFWKGHEGGVLGLGEWQGGLIRWVHCPSFPALGMGCQADNRSSHGRDNVIHFYEPLKRPYIPIPTSSTPDPKSYQPSIKRSLPTNALNFCRFSLVAIPAHTATSVDKKQKEAVMAVPSLIDSELVCVLNIIVYQS